MRAATGTENVSSLRDLMDRLEIDVPPDEYSWVGLLANIKIAESPGRDDTPCHVKELLLS